MGTQITHEPEEPTSGQQPGGSEPSTSQQTPPTQTPTDLHIDPKYVGLLEGTVRAQNERLARMEQEMAAGRAAPPAPPTPPKTPDEQRKEYFDNPQEATRNLIREELQATVGPIAEFVKQFKGASAIDNLVNAARANPKFSAHWSPGIEAYVRDQASQVDPAKLNDSSFGFLVVSAIGMKTAGMINDSTPAPAPTPPTPSTPTPVPQPPYMAPSAPPAPRPPIPNGGRFRPLDETERRLLREYNAGKPADRQMTEQQYREWQELPDESVVGSKIGQPAPVVK